MFIISRKGLIIVYKECKRLKEVYNKWEGFIISKESLQ
jgi:hypothetical protein